MKIQYSLLLVTPLLLTACVDGTYYDSPRPRTTVGVYADSHYDYYYYPDTAVYFQISTGYYYYHDPRNRWIRARQLPSHIHLNTGRRHHLRHLGDKPYLKYDQHRRVYPARQTTIIKERPHDNRRDDRNRHDSNKPWRSENRRSDQNDNNRRDDRNRHDSNKPWRSENRRSDQKVSPNNNNRRDDRGRPESKYQREAALQKKESDNRRAIMRDKEAQASRKHNDIKTPQQQRANWDKNRQEKRIEQKNGQQQRSSDNRSARQNADESNSENDRFNEWRDRIRAQGN